jgi:Fe-S oxidoreductase
MLALTHYLLFLAVTGLGMYMIYSVLYSRYRYIKLGQPFTLTGDPKERWRDFFVNVFGQKKLLKDKKSGVMHVVMFYGFIILQFGALELIVKGLVTGWTMPLGAAHSFFSLMQEFTVLAIMLAAGYAFYRRYIEKLKRLKRGFKAGIVLLFISTLMFSVLLSLGFEALWLGHESSVFAPVSSLIAILFSGIGTTAAKVGFYFFWWIHLLILLSFAVYVPQSKHAHLIFAPINIYLKKMDPPGKLSKIDLEDETAETFGVGKIEQFRQDQMLDLYSCVECGRCTSMCPASVTGKMLSPMHIMTKLRDHLTEKGAAITSKSPWVPAFAFGGSEYTPAGTEPEAVPAQKAVFDIEMVGDVITEQELWACTTCRNCEDQCPVGNEHVDMIIDMRRHLVLTEGKLPSEMNRMMQNIERQSNPWGINRNDRIKWREGMEDIIPTVNETDDFEYLFFVGSMGSYDNRSVKVSQATAKLLNMAGVKFAILGNEEKNSGDTPRRVGNEFLFQQLAAENIETMQRYNVKKIITADPHAYNMLKNEYPDFGLKAEVYHHTEVLDQLIKAGKLKPVNTLNETITYHDSCYLGRYNGVYEQPRDILRAIQGVTLTEMERNRENSMCCGAGGGLMWMEEKEGKRINIERVDQALEVNPTMISSACPYCLTMMNDGIKAKDKENEIGTMDVAEILLKAVV